MKKNPDTVMTGRQLKQARTEMGLSLADMARRLGVNDRTVARWQSGESRIPGPVAVAIREWQRAGVSALS